MIQKQLFKEIEDEMKKVIEFVKKEFGELRTGRANPKMVEGIKVDYYGTPTLLKEIANISVPEARFIIISPWDPSSLKAISNAILESNLGITPINDGKVIKLVVPPLSEERRNDLIKIISKIAEEGRISLRTVRRNYREKIKKLEKEKKITEDEKFKIEDEIQELMDKFIKEIDSLLEEKEKEIRED